LLSSTDRRQATVSDPAPLPLHRGTFHAHRLMTEHPPVLRDPNKRVVK